jgi:alkylation response protein AidB-like acyl-CoA dehydrogenase
MARFGNRDETSALLEDSAGDFLRHRFDAQRLRLQYRGRAGYDRAFWQELAGQGWLALRLPEALGGSELGIEHVAVISHALGRFAAPDPYIACAVMPSVLADSARPEHAAGWKAITEGLGTGETIATVAWQEDAFALEAAMPATVARRDGQRGFRIDGYKCQVVAGEWADLLITSAQMDGEAALFAVPRNAAGVQLQTCLTSDGGSLATVRLQDVTVPAEALLDRGGTCLAAMQRAVDEALVASAAQLLGLAERAFEITLEYLRTRVQFAHPIGSFQAMQHLAVDVRTRLALAGAACGSAVRLQTEQAGSRAACEALAAAKARASDTALQAGRFGVQAHGAIGFAAEADIGCYLKSAIRLAAWLGNGTQHRLRVADLVTNSDEKLRSAA